MIRRVSRGLYRRLLRLMPGDFLERHAEEIETALDADSARNQSVGFWLRALADLSVGLLGEWWHSLRRVLFGELGHDVRLAVRGLAGAPAFTILAVAALAFGMGANTSVFTLVNEVLLRPLPVADPERLVDIHVEQPGANSFTGFSYPEYEDYRDAPTELSGLVAQTGVTVRLGDRDDNVSVSGQVASSNYFEVLGVEPVRGRVYGEEEVRAREHVVVVSDGFWQRRFGGDPSIVGSTIRLNDVPLEIIGVLPPGFTGRFIGFPSEVWIPNGLASAFLSGASLESRNDEVLELFGRLADGATVASAEASLNAIATELEASYPTTNRERRTSVTLMTGLDSSLRPGVLGFAGLVMTLAGLVLVTACLNVGSLLLARGSYRLDEMSVRAALGASRTRLVRQLVVETLVLFGLGTAVAVVVAVQANALLRRFIQSLPVPLGFELSVDVRVFGFAALVGLVTAMATALSPSLRLSSTSPAGALRAGAGQTGGRSTIRGLFLVGQVALSLVLLVAAALFARAASDASRVDVGFDTDMVSIGTVGLPAGHFSEAEAVNLFGTLIERLEASPVIERASFSRRPPIGVSRGALDVRAPGVLDDNGEDIYAIDVNAIGDGYLASVGLDVLSGRPFEAADQESGDGVAVVNRTLAQWLWPEGALGELVEVRGMSLRIVGVVADSRTVIQDATAVPMLYVPAGRMPGLRMQVILRSAAGPGELTPILAAEVAALDPLAAPPSVRSTRSVVELWLMPQRLAGRFATALGVLATILALSGVYGIVSYTVGRRRRELGIRVALGGEPASQVALVMRSGLVLVAVGLGVGLAAVAAMTPLLAGFLAGHDPLDPVALLGATALVVVSSLFAAYVPARRATRVDPVIALRDE